MLKKARKAKVKAKKVKQVVKRGVRKKKRISRWPPGTGPFTFSDFGRLDEVTGFIE